ncbi:MAG: MBL fold metallo-hydrolase, partial [Acidobacteria bacterium]|nr:MBL fold metallo-hydrolase [Acidobacteriota bacterium]
LMIDTGYNAQQMLGTIKERELTLIGIGLTHGHTDHAGGLDKILAEWPVPVYLGNGDFDLLPWKPDLAALKVPTDHHMIAVGELTVECFATPGHTPGGLCYLTTRKGQSLCFVGDTLFAGSIGRTDLWGGSSDAILRSIHSHLLALDNATRVYPGHGPATTIGDERERNPFLQGL